MRFLVDAQLPVALARWLATDGHQAEHVADLGLAGATDKAIWDFALSNGAVILSKDEDFAQRKALAEHAPRVVWIRLPNTRKRELLDWFSRALPKVLEALERGETLIEVV
jgi:predicted nuclease of predicted toxin-antitoxin system